MGGIESRLSGKTSSLIFGLEFFLRFPGVLEEEDFKGMDRWLCLELSKQRVSAP